MIREKVTFLMKALPKALRNRLAPLPDAVTAFLEAAPYGAGPLTDALRGWLRVRTRRGAAAGRLGRRRACRAHLDIEVRVIDAAGNELASGRDLAALRTQLGRGRATLVRAGGPGARAARTPVVGLRRPARRR